MDEALKEKGGETQPVGMQVGEKFLLPEYGGIEVVVGDMDCDILRKDVA